MSIIYKVNMLIHCGLFVLTIKLLVQGLCWPIVDGRDLSQLIKLLQTRNKSVFNLVYCESKTKLIIYLLDYSANSNFTKTIPKTILKIIACK